MTRNRGGLWAAALLSAACQRSVVVRPDVQALHSRLYVFDMHIDSLMAARIMGYDFGVRHPYPNWFVPWMLHTDLPRLRAGGLDGAFLGIIVNPRYRDPAGAVDGQIAFFEHEILRRYPDRITVPRDVDEFVTARAQGKIAVWLSLEGAHELGGDLGNLQRWARHGVRSITLAHFSDNEFAASSASERPAHPGLTPAGRRLICLANRLGIAVDLAHTHPASFYEAVDASRAPVIVSHTGADDVQPTFRNLTDEQIQTVARVHGVVGVLFAGYWLDMRAWASVDTLADHVDAVRRAGGIDTVAVGSDFDGFIWTPRGIRDAGDYPVLTQALADRGYSESDLRKLWGGNVLRTLRDIERVGREMRAAGVRCR